MNHQLFQLPNQEITTKRFIVLKSKYEEKKDEQLHGHAQYAHIIYVDYNEHIPYKHKGRCLMFRWTAKTARAICLHGNNSHHPNRH